MDFGWIKINGYSYICAISNIDMEKQTCTAELDYVAFENVPFNAIQPLYQSTLPWS